jgi:hypothetical protein
MNDLKAQPMFERHRDLEDPTDGPDVLSAIEVSEKGKAPLVGTGSLVGRPLLHILLSEGKVKGWTEDREWAERWANQYYRRSFVSSVQELRPSNNRDERTPKSAESS